MGDEIAKDYMAYTGPVFEVWFEEDGEDVSDLTEHWVAAEELAATEATHQRLDLGPDWEHLWRRPSIAYVRNRDTRVITKIQVTVEAEPVVHATRHIPMQRLRSD